MPAASVPVPSVVVPSMKLTVPLGFRPVTVTLMATLLPTVTVLGVRVSAVVVAAVFTVKAVAAEVLLVLLLSPAYTAVMP